MKKTQIIDLLTTIRKSLVSFLTILIFVCGAVGLFTGLSWTGGALQGAIDSTAEVGQLHDISMTFPYGLTDEDVERLGKVRGVDELEGSHFTYAYLSQNGSKAQVKVTELTDKVDTAAVVKGKLPSKAGEIALDGSTIKGLNIHVGDTVHLTGEDQSKLGLLNKMMKVDLEKDDLQELQAEGQEAEAEYKEGMSGLSTDTFKVTAIIRHPEYMLQGNTMYGVSFTNGGSLNGLMYVTEDSFNADAMMGYTTVNMRSDALRKYSSFDDEYYTELDQLMKRVRKEGDAIALERSDAVKAQADAIMSAAQTELDDAQAQLDAGETKVAQAESLLAQKKKELADGEAKIREGEQLLAEKNALWNEKNQQVSDAASQLAARKAEVDARIDYYGSIYDASRLKDLLPVEQRAKADQIRQYMTDKNYDALIQVMNDVDALIVATGASEIDPELYEGFHARVLEINDKKAQYDNANDLIASAQSQLGDARKQLDAGQAQLDQAKATAASAHVQLRSAEKQLADGKALLKEKKVQLKEAKLKFAVAKEQAQKLTTQKAVYQTRREHASVQGGNNVTIMLSNIRFSMASLFVIIGLLVCYFAIVRLVYNNMTLIGAQKANGFNNREIQLKYLMYTGSATLMGCILGCLVGLFIVQPIIKKGFAEAFYFSEFKSVFGMKELLLISALELILLLAITWLATRKVLKRSAIDLLKGDSGVNGRTRFYEKMKFWNGLPLIRKTIINNFFTDKRRVLGTLVGILGCTSLIVTSITMNNNVVNSLEVQFDDLFHYDHIISFDPSVNANAETEIRQILTDSKVGNASVYNEMYIATRPDGTARNGHIMVFDPQDQNFRKMVTMEPAKGEDAEGYQGVWSNESYKTYYKIKAGDTMSVANLRGQKVQLRIDGFYKYHLIEPMLFMSQKAYRANFGVDARNNTFIIDSKGVDMKALNEKLIQVDGFQSIRDYENESGRTFEMFEKLSKTMVIVYMGLSIVVAIMVLLNILTMFVEEKKRELIIMMINGFPKKTAREYISGDTVLLTVMGIILGLILGTCVGIYTISGFNTADSSYLMRPDVKAMLIGATGTAILSFIMCKIALRRIDHFKLSDINK